MRKDQKVLARAALRLKAKKQQDKKKIKISRLATMSDDDIERLVMQTKQALFA